ncbi:MAG: hypothetical protein CYPHOPRED_001057, partial [Cyphobasidiales sp. Tagirdzhanova-0007]
MLPSSSICATAILAACFPIALAGPVVRSDQALSAAIRERQFNPRYRPVPKQAGPGRLRTRASLSHSPRPKAPEKTCAKVADTLTPEIIAG